MPRHASSCRVISAYRAAVSHLMTAVELESTRAGHAPSDIAKPGDRITQAQAGALLREDASGNQDAVGQQVRVPLIQDQFNALTSFTFNLGAGAQAEFGRSAAREPLTSDATGHVAALREGRRKGVVWSAPAGLQVCCERILGEPFCTPPCSPSTSSFLRGAAWRPPS